MSDALNQLAKAAENNNYCFHGSPANIAGFIKPYQAYGSQEHEQHNAVYASTKWPVALVRATAHPTCVEGSLSWKWNSDYTTLIIEGHGVSFSSGYVYVLDRSLFVLSGSLCKSELISKGSVQALRKILVSGDDLLRASGIILDLKPPPS